MKAKTTDKMMKAGLRRSFIEAGGYDGRYRSRVIKNKKAYIRHPKHRNNDT